MPLLLVLKGVRLFVLVLSASHNRCCQITFPPTGRGAPPQATQQDWTYQITVVVAPSTRAPPKWSCQITFPPTGTGAPPQATQQDWSYQITVVVAPSTRAPPKWSCQITFPPTGTGAPPQATQQDDWSYQITVVAPSRSSTRAPPVLKKQMTLWGCLGDLSIWVVV